VVIGPDGLVIKFNLKGSKFASETFPFPVSLTALSDVKEYTFASKDLAPVLMNLADVTDTITMQGNAHALVFSYCNEVGDSETAIPTLTSEGNRDATLFYGFRKR
jgi:hypothetical protein